MCVCVRVLCVCCLSILFILSIIYILIKLCTSYKYIFLRRSKLKMYMCDSQDDFPNYLGNWRIPEWEVVLGIPDE